MNRIDKLFRSGKKNLLSVYFTAGYPSVENVEHIIVSLDKNGADMIEIGIPYSDPLADGPAIQEAARIALINGMTVPKLFDLLKNIRKKTSLPLLLMGYLNPIIQYGFRPFCKIASETGIDGLIIPDLPGREYKRDYMKYFIEFNLRSIFLISPYTSPGRIREIDELSSGFIYMVSTSSTTGKTDIFNEEQLDYFKRIASMKLKNPTMAGFGIHNRETMEQVFSHGHGAIIGSSYIRAIGAGRPIDEATHAFFHSLTGNTDNLIIYR